VVMDCTWSGGVTYFRCTPPHLRNQVSTVTTRGAQAAPGTHCLRMANHPSTRTTQLYDRRREQLSLDEVERIRV
jgi:hypothetical protein